MYCMHDFMQGRYSVKGMHTNANLWWHHGCSFLVNLFLLPDTHHLNFRGVLADTGHCVRRCRKTC